MSASKVTALKLFGFAPLTVFIIEEEAALRKSSVSAKSNASAKSSASRKLSASTKSPAPSESSASGDSSASSKPGVKNCFDDIQNDLLDEKLDEYYFILESTMQSNYRQKHTFQSHARPSLKRNGKN